MAVPTDAEVEQMMVLRDEMACTAAEYRALQDRINRLSGKAYEMRLFATWSRMQAVLNGMDLYITKRSQADKETNS